MLAPEQVYVRVKRHKQTFFIPCLPDDNMIKIKEKIALALRGSEKDDGIQAETMRLLLPAPKSTTLEDEKKLTDYEIKNDDILHVVFQISENQWETVNVDATDITSNSAS